MNSRAGAAREYTPSRYFAVLVFLVCALYPNEGFLMMVHPQAAKLAPALLLGSWGVWCVGQRRWPVRSPIVMACLLLGAVVLASVAVNYRGDNPNMLVMLIRWLPYLALTTALLDLMATRVSPAIGLMGMGAGAVVAGGGALYAFLVLHVPRATGPMEDPNDLACILVAGLAPLLVLGAVHRRRWVRVASYAGALICLAGAVSTASRGGILAALAMTAWAGAHRLFRARHVVVVGVVLLLVGSVALTVARPVIDNALAQKKNIAGRNIETRELRWNSALAQLSDNPLLGVGPGGNPFNYMAYSNRAELDDRKPVTHNMYIEVGSETGLLGAGLFFYLIFSTLFGLGTIRGPDRRIALAAQGLQIAVLVASFFLSEEYYLQVWLPFAVFGALLHRAQSPRPVHRSSSTVHHLSEVSA